MVFCLFIEDPATRYVKVETYPTAFARALWMITLAPLPLVLTTRDYPDPPHG